MDTCAPVSAEAGREHLRAAVDYIWLLQSGILALTAPDADTDAVWRSFRSGYRAGGEIGRRRYGTIVSA